MGNCDQVMCSEMCYLDGGAHKIPFTVNGLAPCRRCPISNWTLSDMLSTSRLRQALENNFKIANTSGLSNI